ncbi:MATE family efflux transporter [Falsiporphyromonas endometrii]|uniref:Multidrug-efflux transporter n=1 Tax=Falsiporphyromonas endometrii TaxID=1387297 RepID=A0ABV9K8F0_9PORP
MDLTQGNIRKTLILFTLPMLLGALLQQCYNVADSIIVGQFLGSMSLAAVGSAYALMTFLLSIFLGLCLGSGTVFSLHYGAGKLSLMRTSIYVSFVSIGLISLAVMAVVIGFLDFFLHLLHVPSDVYPFMRSYLNIVSWGIPFVFLYNFCAYLLRSVGEALAPLWFLVISVILNIGLDLFFVIYLHSDVSGVAWATLLAQGIAAVTMLIYTLLKRKDLIPRREECKMRKCVLTELLSFSGITCLQQSVMNFGILMVQGLVNSFGAVVMAAFAAGVKIDSFAYMPMQEFGNAFSTFVAQNFGASNNQRVRKGIRTALRLSIAFSLPISALVFIFAPELMACFVPLSDVEVIHIGVSYLRIEGAFYIGIAILFLLYGYYRAIRMPQMSFILTIFSLGIRVVLAYILSSISAFGVNGIWWSIPIGWAIADAIGCGYYYILKRKFAE